MGDREGSFGGCGEARPFHPLLQPPSVTVGELWGFTTEKLKQERLCRKYTLSIHAAPQWVPRGLSRVLPICLVRFCLRALYRIFPSVAKALDYDTLTQRKEKFYSCPSFLTIGECRDATVISFDLSRRTHSLRTGESNSSLLVLTPLGSVGHPRTCSAPRVPA